MVEKSLSQQILFRKTASIVHKRNCFRHPWFVDEIMKVWIVSQIEIRQRKMILNLDKTMEFCMHDERCQVCRNLTWWSIENVEGKWRMNEDFCFLFWIRMTALFLYAIYAADFPLSSFSDYSQLLCQSNSSQKQSVSENSCILKSLAEEKKNNLSMIWGKSDHWVKG